MDLKRAKHLRSLLEEDETLEPGCAWSLKVASNGVSLGVQKGLELFVWPCFLCLETCISAFFWFLWVIGGFEDTTAMVDYLGPCTI